MKPRFVEVLAAPAAGNVDRARPAARLPVFHGTGRDTAAAAAGLRLANVGVGSVGLAFALDAARAGVGEQRLCDPGVLKAESLLTHPIAPAAIGRSKVNHAGHAVKEIHPAGRVAVFAGPVQELDLFSFAGVSAVVIAPDNLLCARDAGEIAQRLGVPLLQASVHGETLTVAVRVFRDACPYCLFTARDREDLVRERRFSCSGPGASGEQALRPTVAPAALCSLAAAELLLTLLRLELGLGDELLDTVYEASALARRPLVTRVARTADCPVDHTPWTLIAHRNELDEATPRELLDAAGAAGDAPATLSFTLEGFCFLCAGVCACGERFSIGRFLPTDERHGPLRDEVARCPRCGGQVAAVGQVTHAEVPVEAMAEVLDQPLCALGAIDVDAVRVQRGEQTVLVGPPGVLA